MYLNFVDTSLVITLIMPIYVTAPIVIITICMQTFDVYNYMPYLWSKVLCTYQITYIDNVYIYIYELVFHLSLQDYGALHWLPLSDMDSLRILSKFVGV